MATGAEEVQDDSIKEEDDFGEAFDEAIAEEGGDEETPTEEAQEPEDEDQTEDPTSEEAEEEVVEEEEEEPKEEEERITDKDENVAEEETIEQVRHKLSTLSGMYNSEVKKGTKLEDELVLLREGKQPSPTAEESGKAEEEVSTLDTSGIIDKVLDLESVKELKEEYGDEIGAAFKDVASAIYEQMSNDFKGQFGEFSEVLKPLINDHSKAAGDSHFNSVEEAHPDFEELGGELKEWIDGKPAYMRPALEAVYTDGSAADVIDLFSTFKDEKGYSKSKEIEKEPEEKIDQDKLEDMETVENRKSPVTSGKRGGASKDDYDAAWDEAN